MATTATAQGQQANVQNQIFQMNRKYMKNTVRRKAVCPPSSGVGLTQTYAPGSLLMFNAPTADNAFLEGFYVRLNIYVDFAGTAVYAATASRELALIQEIDVLYNGTLFQFYPYILPTMKLLRGIYQPTIPNNVLAGIHNTTTDNYITQGSLPISGTAQNIVLEFYVPLNMLHPHDARGLLPIDGSSTTAQINIQCASSLLGNDAVLNTWYQVSGSSPSVAMNGSNASTVQLIACYRDGTSFNGPASLPLQTAGIGNIGFQYDIPLTSLTSGQIYRQKISKLQTHYYAILTIVDGQQATKYAAESNIAYLDFCTDSTGNHPFWKVGTGTNLSVQEYFIEMREMLKQDLPEGIVPLVYAPVDHESDPNNLNGSHVLNMDPTTGAGNYWTDTHYGIQLSSLASTLTGVTPRCLMHLVWAGNQGLIATS